MTTSCDVVPEVARELLDEHRRVNDLDLIAELRVVGADRLHAVRARRDDLLHAGGLQILDVAVGQLLIHVLVAGALGRIAVAALLCEHAELHVLRAQDREQRAQRFLEVGVERAGAAEPDQHIVLRRDRTSRAAADWTNFVPLVVAEAPDVAAPLEIVVHRAEIIGRIAVATQTAARCRSESAGARCRPDTGSRTRRTSCTATAPSRE